MHRDVILNAIAWMCPRLLELPALLRYNQVHLTGGDTYVLRKNTVPANSAQVAPGIAGPGRVAWDYLATRSLFLPLALIRS